MAPKLIEPYLVTLGYARYRAASLYCALPYLPSTKGRLVRHLIGLLMAPKLIEPDLRKNHRRSRVNDSQIRVRYHQIFYENYG